MVENWKLAATARCIGGVRELRLPSGEHAVRFILEGRKTADLTLRSASEILAVFEGELESIPDPWYADDKATPVVWGIPDDYDEVNRLYHHLWSNHGSHSPDYDKEKWKRLGSALVRGGYR